ncbi:NACHT domain-containing protein [Streptomyces sp. HC44]|uniref:NACHT domain-containing protein n=1 Tax=Streptomyces scabichelini TaxID=2711217 RepID=A0A6G4VLK2_9ACTN|nr:NACHT domain-containing protein [Streptomyces scabichelini]NGO14851.1 NACHT domain-containing protein [Streptomyces scabichelini]
MVDPGTVGVRIASSVVAPLVRKLFVREGPGAGLVERPVRISALVSFKGEKRTLEDKDLRKLVRELVRRAAARETAVTELTAVTDALERTLYALSDLDIDDAEAVRLGHRTLAGKLHGKAGGPRLVQHLSQDCESLYSELLEKCCLHILHFLTQRSTFVARTLVEQSRRLDELIARTDILIERLASRSAEDAGFEERYATYIARKYGHLTIYGIDLNECGEWPLATAYLSLKATRKPEHQPSPDGDRDFLAERWTASPPQPVEDALAGHHRVLLRGAAGSGKTTLVQWLAVSAAQQDRLTGRLAHLMGRVPFVLPLRTLTRGGAKLPIPADFLTSVSCPLAGSQPPGWADRVLTAGRGLLLIDGMDEVPEQEREPARRWLRDLLTAFPGNLWLVTSRPSAVRDDWLGGEDFTEMTLARMSRENIAVFIRRWHEAAGADPALGETLLNTTRTKQDLGRLATNPLMCALICALHRERRGFLPRGRKALYDAALSMLLERRDRERGMAMETELDEESQIELLQKLAYWLIRNGRSEMDRADAVAQLERLLPSMPYVAEQGSPEDILRYLLDRSGLLREPTLDAVDFVHRTFQDYLGARAAIEERDFDLLARHAHLDQWEDVVRMAVAHARPDERARLLRGLLERGDAEPEHRPRLELLAMACLEHAAKLDPTVREEVERRAGELIPPRSYQEAVELADLGPIVLELLPAPDCVADETEAALVVRTAGLIGGDAALSCLVRYRDHESQSVNTVLGSCWDRFDTETYANEIIRYLRAKQEALITVSSEEQLASLERLGGHGSVACQGDFTGAQITQALPPGRLQRLNLVDNSAIDDLEFVTSFRNLNKLTLADCAGISNLAPLTRLPLTTLILQRLPQVTDLGPLRELSQLTMLSLSSDTEWPGLDIISPAAPLSCLLLPSNAHSLTALTELRSLYQLGLHLATPLTPEDWQAIASLKKLEALGLSTAEQSSLADTGTPLDNIRVVQLMADHGTADLRLTTTVFPALTSLYVHDADAIDLAPLASHPELKHVSLSGRGDVHNADTLPHSVQLTAGTRRLPR